MNELFPCNNYGFGKRFAKVRNPSQVPKNSFSDKEIEGICLYNVSIRNSHLKLIFENTHISFWCFS